LVIYGFGLFVHRYSPIQVVTILKLKLNLKLTIHDSDLSGKKLKSQPFDHKSNVLTVMPPVSITVYY